MSDDLGEALRIERPSLGIDHSGRYAALEQRDPLMRGGGDHLQDRLVRQAGVVRGGNDVVHRQQRMIQRRRLLQEHIQPGAGQLPLVQRLGQGCLVMDAAAGGVDEIRVRLHRRELRRAQHAEAFFGARAMDT